MQLYRCTSCKYIFTFCDLGINLQIFLYFQIFVDPTHNVNYKGKQNSEKIERVKIEGKLHNSDHQQHYFVLQLYKVTLENLRQNVSNLHRNNVNIALANYVIKLLKSIYLYFSVLVVGPYHRISKFYLSKYYLICVRIALDYYLLKLYK